MLWPHLVNFLLFMPNRREKRTENNPHVSVDIWKRKKKIYESKIKAKIKMKILKKKLTMKKKKLLTNIWDYEISWMPLFHLNMVFAVAIWLFLLCDLLPLVFDLSSSLRSPLLKEQLSNTVQNPWFLRSFLLGVRHTLFLDRCRGCRRPR